MSSRCHINETGIGNHWHSTVKYIGQCSITLCHQYLHLSRCVLHLINRNLANTPSLVVIRIQEHLTRWNCFCRKPKLFTATMELFLRLQGTKSHGFWCLFVTRLLSLVRFWCLFVSKKTPNNAAMPQSLVVLIVLVNDQHNEYHQALWHHSIVWRLFGDKQTSKSHET